MSIIQNIRDKYARVAVIAIALALIGFILTDYVAGKNRSRSGGRSNSVGTVNGQSINADEFAKAVEQTEAGMKQQGYPDNAAMKQQAIDQSWAQEINLVLLNSELDKLGMQIGKKERGDILYGPNAPQDIKKAGTDEKTGQYDPIRAKQQVDQMMKNNKVPQSQKDDFNNYINDLERQRKIEKYFSLFTNSINYPRWFIEKQNADNSLLGKISMVKTFYTDSVFVDSTIKISDKEISGYISKHKEDFKQPESRSINYVSFSAAPTSGDTAAIKKQITLLKPEFDTTKDVATFLARNGSQSPSDVYNTAAQLSQVAKDSILRLAKNEVFGPYLDGNSFVLVKLLDIKVLPDSVKCRHILLGTKDRSGNQIMDDTVAHKRADSIALAIKNGANFDSLEAKFTTDNAAHKDKGVMTFSSSAIQGEGFAKEFGQFILFDGKPGDKKVVKTQFGWHYIEILSFIKPETQYKTASLTQEIVASQQTDGDALQAANVFFGDCKDQKSFDETFEKTLKPKGLVKGIGMNIRRNDGQVQGLGFSRSFIRNIYAAKSGETLKPERINDAYVVAIVTEVLEEGTQTVAKARIAIEPLLRNKKKAAILKQRIGKVSTLEAAAAVLNKPIETVDSLRMSSGSPHSNFGNEPKINGAAFNPANKGKMVPEALEGINGVYVIRVDNVSATAVTGANVADQRKEMYQRAKQSAGSPLDALKDAATIKDKRSERY